MLKLVYTSILALAVTPAWAIFVNGGFETGDFSGWTKGAGTNPGLTGAPPFTEANIVIGAGGADHSTIVGAIADPRAPALVLPRAGASTAKVEDEGSGANLNYIRQSGIITNADRDPGDGKLHVRFSYAAVLEDPGHAPTQQPYFHVGLKNLTKSTTLYDDFTYSNQPGKTFVTTGSWKSTPFVNVNIIVAEADLGDTLQIEALAADCSLGGHGGYVYLDGFGSAVIPPTPGTATPIPTLNEWALIVLAIGVVGTLLWLRRSEG